MQSSHITQFSHHANNLLNTHRKLDILLRLLSSFTHVPSNLYQKVFGGSFKEALFSG